MNDDQLQESLHELYEQAPCGYIFTRPDGTIVRVNQTFLDWTGYTRDALVSSTRFQNLLTVPGRIFYENQYAPLLRMQGFVREVAFDLVRTDKEPLPVLVNSVQRVDASGRPLLVASTIFDASDRRRYELELLSARRRAEHLAEVVTAASDGIVSTTPECIVQTWNTGAERLFGYTAQTVVGRSLGEILSTPTEDEDWQHTIAKLHTGQAVHVETVGVRADGRPVDVSVALTPHVGPLGELSTVSAIIRDISERRALERLQQDFLAMVTHELKNPLASLKGYAQLMRRRGSYDERALGVVIAQSARLERLIGDLLDVSRVEAGQLELQRASIDLVDLLHGVVEQAQALTRDHTVRLEAPPTPLIGQWDRLRLEQVLQNLLSNAVKYSPDGGEIVVRARDDGQEAVVSVQDQGVGISADSLPRLFARFYRTLDAIHSGAEGLGLGLFISRSIVEAHGGRIWADSELGRGSTFSIALPYSAPAVEV